MGIKSILFTPVYYLLVLNWKLDSLDKKILGVSYLIFFILIPIFFTGTSLWLPVMMGVVLVRVSYLIGVLDYFSKKLGG